MVTPYDFYRMTDLCFEGAIINLDSVSGIQLSLDMLGRKYYTRTIHYFDLVSNYMLLPQRTREERVRMARLFLLHLLRAYLFANGGKMVSLRWLTLFRTLKRHKEPIRGKQVLPIFTPPSTLSTGAPCNSLWGLGSFLRLVLFPFLAFSFVACSLANCIVLHLANCHLASNL